MLLEQKQISLRENFLKMFRGTSRYFQALLRMMSLGSLGALFFKYISREFGWLHSLFQSLSL
jgi:hypothetical protein